MPVSVSLVRNDFAKIAARLREKAAVAVTAVTEEIAAAAEQAAPFPEIAESITVEQEDDLHQAVLVGLWWAGFWEYGTVGFAARPYLTPATEHHRQQLIAETSAALRP